MTGTNAPNDIGGMGMVFAPSEKYQPAARRIFRNIRNLILSSIPNAEVVHIGGTSIPGALTKGDVDIQVRIGKKSFEDAKKIMANQFETNNLHLWNKGLAIFRDERGHCWQVDMLLTMIGSTDDNCRELRDLLIRKPELLFEYNQVKLNFGRADYQTYKRAKGEFYTKLRGLLEKPASGRGIPQR